MAEHTKNQNITAEKRLLTWPVGALACAVCLLAGLVIGLLLGPLVVLLASLAATIYPALRLRRLEPVDAMRSA